jgi:hypothetical protein
MADETRHALIICHCAQIYLLSLSAFLKYFLTVLEFATYTHTYHSHFIAEGVTETSQSCPQFTKKLSYDKYCRRDRWQANRRQIAVILGVNAINRLVAFYDILGRKREVFFYSVPDTTRDSVSFLKIL